MTRLLQLWVGTAVCLAPPVQAATDTLLLTNASASTLDLIDPVLGTPRATARVGDGPSSIAVSPDGRLAVVSNTGQEVAGATLTVVDIESGRLVRTVRLVQDDEDEPTGKRTFWRPQGLTFLPDGQHVLVVCEHAQALLVVDALGGQVVGVADTGGPEPMDLVVSADGRRAFVANRGNGTVGVIDVGQRTLERVIEAGGGSTAIAVSPDGATIWVANSETDSISVIDVATRTESVEFPCGAEPVAIAFLPDGERALVVNRQSGTVSVFDVAAKQTVQEFKLGSATEEQAGALPAPPGRPYGLSSLPTDVTIAADATRAWVTRSRCDDVAEVDLATGRVIRLVPSRGRPLGVSYVLGRGPAVQAK